ncbi:MAG: fumarate hydratase, partial [Firmicutes bacterium]|nr:fumarate hydratase [Bacillota bacterium]
MIRTIQADAIADTVAKLCVTACTVLPAPVRELLQQAQLREPYAPAKESLSLVCENCRLAQEGKVPLCQDTGMTVVVAEIGQDVHIEGGALEDAVNRGVRRGYTEGYLRKSVVRDPFDRVNTGDNTPAALHVKLVPGDSI